MATDPTVNLRGDASSLVKAIDQATTAFINFEQATARIVKDTATLNEKSQILTRTITQLDAAGNEVVTTWKKVKGVVSQTTKVIRAQAGNLKVLASQASLAAEATALIALANEKAASSGVKQDAQLVATAAALKIEAAKAFEAAAAQEALAVSQRNSGAAAAARVKGTRLNILAEELATKSIAASNAARASAVPIIDAEVAALRRRAAAINASIAGVAGRAPIVKKAKTQRFKDEDRVQGQFQALDRKRDAERQAAIKRQVTQRLADEKRVALEFIKLTVGRNNAAKKLGIIRLQIEQRLAAEFKKQTAQRIADDQTVIDARILAEIKAGDITRALFKKQAIQRLADEKRVAAQFKKQTSGRVIDNQKVVDARIRAELKAGDLNRAAIKKQIIQRLADEQRVAAAFTKQTNKRIADDQRVIDARISAQLKANALRDAAIKKQTIKRLADEKRVAAAFRKQTAQRITDEQKIINVRISAQLKANAIRDAAIKKQVIQRIAAEKRVAAEFIKLDNLRRGRELRTRTPIVGQRLRTGTAGKKEIATFLKAEAAARKFAATSVTAFKQVDAAIAQARAGTLKFTGNLNQAEIAALKLVAAERQVAAGANQANAATKGLGKSLKSLGSLIGISLLIGGAFRLVTAFTDAARSAGQLTIKIAEIETISTSAARSTEAWAEDLRKLSNEFGIDTLSQAEGAYQILSRQIKNAAGASIQGAEALKFLAVANKLAVVGVTDTATATNLLTSAMNAFKIPAEQAEVVASKLFKAVELGALRIEDIADILGRVAVPAKALGLSLDEVLGSIDGLTRQGFKANEAITGMRNVILKLLKPTKAGSEALRQLGADTGQALIQARGFIPGLTAFIKELGDTVEGTAKGFGRIRAIVGALGLTGENAEAAADSIRQIKDATIEAFSEDTLKVLRSTGKQFEIMREQAQNLFEKELGGPALIAIAAFVKESGGIKKILDETIKVMKLFGQGLFAFAKIALLVAQNIRIIGVALAATFVAKRLIALQALLGAMTLFETASFGAAAAQEALAASTLKANLALLLSPIGIAIAATAAIVGISILAKKVSAERLKAAEDTNAAILKSNKDLQSRIESANKENTQAFKKELDKRFKAIALIGQRTIGALNKNQDDLTKQAKATAISTGQILKVFAKNVSSLLSSATKELKTFEKNAEKASAAVQKILQGEDKAQFDIDVGIAGFGTAIKLVKAEITKARAEVAKATEAGDFKRFETQRKRLNDLIKQRIESEVKFAKSKSKIDRELEDARFSLQEASTREERQAADERIAGLERQQKILRDGNGAQLQQEQALAKIREKARTAQDAASFKEALDSLSKLKREQERLNILAATERSIRAATTLEAAKQAVQAARIAEINKKRADQARKEQQAIKALDFQFNLVKKTAEAFNIERVLEGETAKEINEAVVEQQKNFAKLITLSRALTGGTELDASFIEQETQLRLQARNRIEILEEKAQAKRLEEIRKELQGRLDAVKDTTKADLIRLDIVQKRSSQLFALQTNTLAGQDRAVAGNKIRIALGEEADPGRAKLAQSEESIQRFDILIEEAKLLNNLIIEQTKAFSGERQTRIDRLVSQITSEVGGIQNLEEVGAARRERSVGGTTGAEREIQDINATILAFVASIQKLARPDKDRDFGAGEESGSILKRLSESQDETSRIVKAIADFTSPQEQAIKTEIEKRDENSTELERSTRLITEFNDLISGKQRVLEGPSDAPESNILPPEAGDSAKKLFKKIELQDTNLANVITGSLEKGASNAQVMVEKSTKDAVSKGAKEGFEDAASETLKKAREAAKVAKAAEEKARKERDTNLSRQIAELEAGIKRRQALALAPAAPLTRAKDPEFKGKEVDTTIFLGQGALPIAVQQAKIQEALAKAAEENAKAQQAQDNRSKRDAAILKASGKGRTGANAGGLFTRGRTGVPRAGVQIGPRPGSSTQAGEGPTQKKQLTAAEQIAANTKFLADEVKARKTQKEADAKAREARPQPGSLEDLGGRRVTAGGPGVANLGAGFSILDRGQEEAAVELARITGRNAEAQNRLLRVQEVTILISEENNSAQNQFVNSIRTGIDETDKMFLINRQRIPVAQAALDAEQRALDNFLKAEEEARTFDTTKPRNTFGQARDSFLGFDPTPPARGIATTQFNPSQNFRAPGANESSVTNIGGIQITVNESKTPKATAQELADTLNRGFRTGVINLSHNKSGPFTFASRRARGER